MRLRTLILAAPLHNPEYVFPPADAHADASPHTPALVPTRHVCAEEEDEAAGVDGTEGEEAEEERMQH